jgi:hypothetical protein
MTLDDGGTYNNQRYHLHALSALYQTVQYQYPAQPRFIIPATFTSPKSALDPLIPPVQETGMQVEKMDEYFFIL